MSNEQFNFKVNLGGMIDILSNHLYSSPGVYIRELLQNGVDAITARQTLNPKWAGGEITLTLCEGSSLSFRDNGTGLTEEEIHTFLAIIGQSSKRSKEDVLKASDTFIGRFGIGLLSCFMVSDKITIRTRSTKDGQSNEWCGHPDGTYTITKPTEPFKEGTEVFLQCKKGCEEYFSSERIRELINYYGILLPYPIIFNNGETSARLNRTTLPWDSEHFDRAEVMEFGRQMFYLDEMNESFIDCIPLISKEGDVSGVAYIVPYRVQPSVKSTHRVFLKNMLLTENAENLLPDWAVFVKCIINAHSLRPTASREGFYEDDALEAARENISGCIAEYLTYISKHQPELFKKILGIHELCIKSIAIDNDELYKLFFDHFTFETTQGTMTGQQLRQCNSVITYTPIVDRFKNYAQIYFARDRLLINAGYVYDRELIERMGKFFGTHALPLQEEDAMHVMTLLDAAESGHCALLKEAAAEALRPHRCAIEVTRFTPNELPAFYSIGSDAQLMREIVHSKEHSDEMFGEMLDAFSEHFNINTDAHLYLNLNNPIIAKLALSKNSETIKSVIEIIYVQTLLIGRHPLQNNELSLMNNRIMELIDDIL